MTNSDIVDQLKQASENLLWMSESEYPFEVFRWKLPENQTTLTPATVLQLTNQPPDTPVEEVKLDDFFAPVTEEQDWYEEAEKATMRQYQNLVKTITSTLASVRVYRVGKRNIRLYIVGTTPEGDWAGLSTSAVET